MSIVTLNDRAVRSVSAFGSLNTGSMIFIKKLTASSSGTLSFVNGSSDVVLDSTYKEYLFTFKNIHPATNRVDFQFQASTNGGSSYGVTLTTTHFKAYHNENDDSAALPYVTGDDLAQSTSFQDICVYMGNDNEDNNSGTLTLFNPASTTFVKHFMCRTSVNFDNDAGDPYAQDQFTAGHFNTTSAINAIQFKCTSGNIDAGDICLYGIL